MWYVLQVSSGREEVVREYCDQLIEKELLEETFIPLYEQNLRYAGTWHRVQKRLFPGYLFIITSRLEELFFELKKIPELTKILGYGGQMVPLSDEEVTLIRHFGGAEHLVPVSTGYMVGNEVIVTGGPMKGYEGCIRKIDRHKRVATLEVNFFNRKTEIEVGLEIVSREKEYV